MSHEIRTPLGAVLGFSELLMEAGISERERQVYMTMFAATVSYSRR